jgi:hypothetical protein
MVGKMSRRRIGKRVRKSGKRMRGKIGRRMSKRSRQPRSKRRRRLSGGTDTTINVLRNKYKDKENKGWNEFKVRQYYYNSDLPNTYSMLSLEVKTLVIRYDKTPTKTSERGIHLDLYDNKDNRTNTWNFFDIIEYGYDKGVFSFNVYSRTRQCPYHIDTRSNQPPTASTSHKIMNQDITLFKNPFYDNASEKKTVNRHKNLEYHGLQRHIQKDPDSYKIGLICNPYFFYVINNLDLYSKLTIIVKDIFNKSSDRYNHVPPRAPTSMTPLEISQDLTKQPKLYVGVYIKNTESDTAFHHTLNHDYIDFYVFPENPILMNEVILLNKTKYRLKQKEFLLWRNVTDKYVLSYYHTDNVKSLYFRLDEGDKYKCQQYFSEGGVGDFMQCHKHFTKSGKSLVEIIQIAMREFGLTTLIIPNKL